MQSLGQQLTQEKIKNMQKDAIINNLGKELSKLKLEMLQNKGGNL
ncbi:XkdW family protein [Clostridium sporogenes]|nr:XkdW family protein [Clostridium sporogenes]MCR1974970.1 XkdW family protein [Clostridium sporogenes]